MVDIIVGKFEPPVQRLIEAELNFVDDRDRIGTIFDIIRKICGQTQILGEIYIKEYNLYIAGLAPPLPTVPQSHS